MHRWRGLFADSAVMLLFLGAWLFAGTTVMTERQHELPAASRVAAIVFTAPPARDTAAPAYDAHMLTRNPFVAPNHTAMNGAASSNAGRSAETAITARLLLRLMGTTVMPNDRSFAVISVTGAAPVPFRVGDEVKGWTIIAIERGRVRLQRDGRTEELELTRGP